MNFFPEENCNEEIGFDREYFSLEYGPECPGFFPDGKSASG